MENGSYRLDRTAFAALTFKEADAQMQNSSHLTPEERFNHFNYLMSVAYRFLGKPFPRMDKTAFEIRKRD